MRFNFHYHCIYAFELPIFTVYRSTQTVEELRETYKKLLDVLLLLKEDLPLYTDEPATLNSLLKLVRCLYGLCMRIYAAYYTAIA
jgi:hypothetical protein